MYRPVLRALVADIGRIQGAQANAARSFWPWAPELARGEGARVARRVRHGLLPPFGAYLRSRAPAHEASRSRGPRSLWCADHRDRVRGQLRALRRARRAPERLPSHGRGLHLRMLHSRHRACLSVARDCLPDHLADGADGNRPSTRCLSSSSSH